ncbi:uncharacterized protein LOC130992811 isoform X2 [Salvia miltiorrhiza]|uniref:uncharacterized protein LOC130992811 isoform X2 n=1 Tax=Salvia miltiorrhiza TaxID=226208 RepID=UPI0025AD9C61|nr:uncharacterized protein LOC130992811 isoform X2 [Salvia miltiorrhiza]
MATSSRSCFSPTDLCPSTNNISHNLPKNSCLIRSKTNLQLLPNIRSSKKDLIVRNVTSPEAAADLVSSSAAGGDLLSSFSLPTVEGISDNPWLAGIAGLAVGVPFLIQWLVTVSKEVEVVAETVEKIADAVGNAAEEVDKVAEDLAEALPEGGLKQVVSFVEDLAEETAKETQMVEDLMDKVEEMNEKLEQALEKESKGTDNQ